MQKRLLVFCGIVALLFGMLFFTSCGSGPTAQDLIHDTYYDWSRNELRLVYREETYRAVSIDLLTQEDMDTFTIQEKVSLRWEDAAAVVLTDTEDFTYYVLGSAEYPDGILLIPKEDESIFPLGEFARPLGYVLQKSGAED